MCNGGDNLCLFFFSSRRRHTRLTCDWSSDVCSSDLDPPTRCRPRTRLPDQLAFTYALNVYSPAAPPFQPFTRSEERRVGKECRSRRSPYTENKTTNGHK